MPLIVTLHGYDVTTSDQSPSNSTGRAYLARRKELWERASLFICVSEHIRRQALQRGFPGQKLWVHRIGIDLRACEPMVPRDRRPTVLFVGRLVEKKGCIHLIRAMAQVSATLPTAQLVVIGDGPLRSALEGEARKRLPGTIFLGTQPAAVVRRWMQRAWILAVPSVVAKNGDTEGLPTVLCEAQALGLPIVAFRGPGVAEAVVDGETALLVHPLDEQGLASAIVRLCLDPRRCKPALARLEGITLKNTSISRNRPRFSKTNTTRSLSVNERTASPGLTVDDLRPVRYRWLSRPSISC